MKQLIGNGTETYTFTPGGAGAGTVIISGIPLTINQILLINNATKETVIYNPFVSGKGYASVSTGTRDTLTITLELTTSTHSSGDKLQIFYDNSNQVEQTIADMSASMKALYNAIIRPIWHNGKGSLNVDLINSTGGILSSVTTVSTVSTVTSMSQLAGMDAKAAIYDPLQEISFALNIRDKIT